MLKLFLLLIIVEFSFAKNYEDQISLLIEDKNVQQIKYMKILDKLQTQEVNIKTLQDEIKALENNIKLLEESNKRESK